MPFQGKTARPVGKGGAKNTVRRLKRGNTKKRKPRHANGRNGANSKRRKS